MARLSVSQSCLLRIFVVLQNTIKAARMRGLRRSGVMENVRLFVLSLDNIARDCVTWSTVDVYVGCWSYVYTLSWYANI